MNKNRHCFWNAVLVLLTAIVLLSGCASTAEVMRDNSDPFEHYNRAMFNFNDKVDKAIIKPVAKGYRAITPEFVDTGVTNFFSNLRDVVVVANDLLQLKFEQAAMDTGRFAVNSTFGLLGLLDVATPMGLAKHNEDFGQTLGYWGIGEGYYVVLPILGPSTTRDIFSYPVDYYLFYPVNYVDPVTDRAALYGLEIVDTRADYLRAEKALSGAALDPYTFQREAYLQRRRNLVYDGNPPKPELGPDDEDTAPNTPPKKTDE